MTIFGYTLPEIQKFLVALAALLIAALAIFIPMEAGFQEGVETLIIAVVGAIGVFGLPNPNPDDINKALAAVVTSAVSVIQFYHTVPSSTTTKVVALVYAFAVAYCVWRKSNKSPINAQMAMRS